MLQLSYLKQETMCDALTFTSAGSRSLQMSILSAHLGSKGQPARGTDESDESPRITGSLVLRPLPRSSKTAGMDAKRAFVYGCWGDASTVAAGPHSTTWPP